MKEENWKKIPWAPDYLVSDKGEVYSVPRTYLNKNGIRKKAGGKLMSLIKHSEGYRTLVLRTNSGNRTCYVHRLVGEVFIDNPENLPQINHKNGIRHDNRVENLEWCDNSYNNKHSYDVLGRKKVFGKYGKLNGRSKPVQQYSKDLEFLAEYESARCAERATGVHYGNISGVCNGRKKSAGGFVWKFKKQS